MPLEIERKFLLKNDSWKSEVGKGIPIKQGYLNATPERTVRIRVFGDKAVLTVKGKNDNLTRKEFEYEIPVAEAQSMLELCEKPLIEKVRYLKPAGNNVWEIDVFEGVNNGLIVAEIELNSEEEKFETPDWLGEEVSFDTKYYNSSLIAHPFSKWT